MSNLNQSTCNLPMPLISQLDKTVISQTSLMFLKILKEEDTILSEEGV